MKPRNHTPNNDEGAVAVIAAVFIAFVCIGLAAFAVDAGYHYAVRRQLQASADAAALAGCQEKISGAGDEAVLAKAEEYALRNAVAPGDNLFMIRTAPLTEVGADYVKVTVEKDTPTFFGLALGRSRPRIRAQAKAKVAYVTGMKGLIPWSVPIIAAPNKVTARLDGGTEYELTYQSGTGYWTGQIPVPPASTTGHRVDVTAYNAQTAYPDGTSEYPDGVPECLVGAGSVYVRDPASPITAVDLTKRLLTVGVPEDAAAELFVESTATPSVRFNGRNYGGTLYGTNRYRFSLPIEQIEDLSRSFPIDVSAGGTTIRDADRLVVRRATLPFKDVTLSPNVVTAGAGGSVAVAVRLNDYQYGDRYELKVTGGGAEVGNFAALDFRTIKHPPNWMNPQHPSECDPTADPSWDPPCYYNYLEKPFPFVIHIGDTIWTETGNLSGPTSDRSLDIRFGTDTRTFEQWEGDGSPRSSLRIVYVPVMEKMQITTGQTPLRVVALAAFYVEPNTDIAHDDISGRFIEYVAPSDAIQDEDPGGFSIKTSHLVDVDF